MRYHEDDVLEVWVAPEKELLVSPGLHGVLGRVLELLFGVGVGVMLGWWLVVAGSG